MVDRRRAKTDAIDGETLLRTLLAWTRGEPRVCAMVVPPTPEEEDRRRRCRERAILLQERIRHTNRIKGLLADRASRTSIHCIRTAGSCSTRLAQGTVVRFRSN
jgi:transposase